MLKELILTPLRAERRRIIYAVLALVCLACAQSGFLLAVKPLFGFLFADVQKEVFRLADILPPGLAVGDLGSIPRDVIQLYLPIFLIVASAIKSLATYIYRYQQEALSLHVAGHYRDTLFERILSQPFLKLGSKEPGHWMSIIMNDVFYLQTRFSEVASSLVKDGVSLVASLVVIALYSPLTALVLLVVGPLLMIRLGTISKRISGYAEKWQNDIAMLASKVLDVRRRFGFIRSQHAEPLEAQIFAKQNTSYYETVRSSIALRASFSPMVEYIGFLLFAGIMATINYDKDLLLSDPTDLLAYLAAMAVLLKPMRNIGEQVTRYQETMGSLSESLKVFAPPPAEIPSQTTLPTASDQPASSLNPSKGAWQGVIIQSLTTGYGAHAAVMTMDGPLAFRSGRLMAIIGDSGSGKSTFAKTLGGLLPPLAYEGDPPLAEVQRHCAYVSQFPYMFRATIRDNILYGSPKLADDGGRTEERLRKALKIADVWQDIAELPQGLDTVIDPVHSNLSGGQLQRLSIARGILQNRKILVLDESTASVSEASEQRILAALRSYATDEDRVVVAITHRLSALEFFHDVLWLADGTLKLSGTCEEVRAHPEFRAYAPSATAAHPS